MATAPKIKWYYRIVNDEIVKSKINTEDSFALLIDAKSELAGKIASSIRRLDKKRFEVWTLTKDKIREV